MDSNTVITLVIAAALLVLIALAWHYESLLNDAAERIDVLIGTADTLAKKVAADDVEPTVLPSDLEAHVASQSWATPDWVGPEREPVGDSVFGPVLAYGMAESPVPYLQLVPDIARPHTDDDPYDWSKDPILSQAFGVGPVYSD